MPNSKYYYLITLILFLFQGVHFAQEMPLASFLNQLEQQYGVTFNYNVEAVESATIRNSQNISSFDDALRALRINTPFLYRKVSAKIVTMLKYESSIICGYLKDRETREIITEATITHGTKRIRTDSDGYFEFEWGLSTEITVNALGYNSAVFNSSLSGQNKCTTLYLSREEIALGAVQLTGYIVKGVNKFSDGSFDIDFKNFSLLPGLVETDVLQATQALPGIQSTDETVSNINIRGGSNDQNLILWDDIKMYQSGHFFGLISAFNPNITQSVSVIKNGSKAAYTDGVSGTISMHTEDDIAQSTSGSFGAGMLSTDGFLDMVLSDKSSVQLAFRRSINGILKTPTYESYFNRISQESDVFKNDDEVTNSEQNFSFYDGSLRWLYHISKKDKLRLNFLVIDNNLSFLETATSSTIPESKTSSLDQNSISNGLYYEHTWNKNSKTHVQFYQTNYKLKSINANIILEQRLLQENRVSESSTRLQHDHKKNDQLRFSGGYHFTESGVTNITNVNNPLFIQRFKDVVRSHAIFGQGYYNTSSRKTKLSLGLRADYLDKFDRVLIEPRLNFSHRFRSGFTLQALGEYKHQNTSQLISLQNDFQGSDFLGIERRRWQLANDEDIPVIQSKQISLGLSYKRNGWLIDGTGYYKAVEGITAQSQGFDTKYEFARASGSYNVSGLDLLIRKNIGAFNTWLSYGYMDNEYTFKELEDVNFPSNFDITHSITLGITYENKKLRVSTGLNWHKGQPTTFPVLGNEILEGNVNFGAANSDNLPNYTRVDASVIYDVIDNDQIRLETGVSLWNILNSENRIGSFYRPMGDKAMLFEQTALGTTMNATMRLHF